MQPNNIVGTLQQQLNITKKDIADYLGVSKAFIGMVEQGKKNLSTNNLFKITALYQLSQQNNTTYSTAEINAQQAELLDFLENNNKINNLRKKRLQLQLSQIKTSYNNALKTLQTVRSLQNSLANTKQNKKDLLWCAVIEANAIETIKVNGLVVQKKLEDRINKL